MTTGVFYCLIKFFPEPVNTAYDLRLGSRDTGCLNLLLGSCHLIMMPNTPG